MKLIMENWRKFCKESLLEGPVIDMPSGNSEEYRKMIKRKEDFGFEDFYVTHSEAPANIISKEDFLDYITIFSREEPEQETLRNMVRYLVRKYCKNRRILNLFSKLENLKPSEVSNRLLKLAGKDFIERWHQRSNARYHGTYSNVPNNDQQRYAPTIDIYAHAGWRDWYGWDEFVKNLSPFVRTYDKSNTDQLRVRPERKYKLSVVRNFNKFLNIIRALWVSTTYVHELAHATDPNRNDPDGMELDDPAEIYATRETMQYIKNLKKGILKDIFKSKLPGNFSSWGSNKPTFRKDAIPVLSILDRKDPKQALSKEIGDFLDWILQEEKEYHKISHSRY